MSELAIFADEARVGAVVADELGPSIRYEHSWRAAGGFPISLSMPLDQESWGPERAQPWLMNLLPEGEPFDAFVRALGVAASDVVAMTRASGRDLAGALTFGFWDRTRPSGYIAIENAQSLERIIAELPSKPFLVGEDGVSMSLAGAQEKLPVAIEGGRLAIPINGAPSTHILKPDNPRLPGSVQNEALCMTLARLVGLDVAQVTTGSAGDRSYLLVTRYDRVAEQGKIRRLHQEDFCQALGRTPAAKYERNGTGRRGPSIADMFALVREHMNARDITRLLDAVILNIAIGNVDSHAKNYSILLTAKQSALAPLYDLMSGLSWERITQNHAQAIGDQMRGRHIYGRHWRRMANDAGLAGPATVRRVIALAERIVEHLPRARDEVAAMPAGAGAMLDVFVKDIEARATLVAANARVEGVDTPEQAAEENSASKYQG